MFFTKVCGQVMEYNKQPLMQLEMSDHVNSAGGREQGSDLQHAGLSQDKIWKKIKGDLHFIENGRRRSTFLKMEDDLNFFQMEDDLNILVNRRRFPKFKKRVT